MAVLGDIISTVNDFIKETFDASDVKVVRVVREGDVWETESEVYEESSFIKALGLPTRVRDKNIYRVVVNNDLEIISYERLGHQEKA